VPSTTHSPPSACPPGSGQSLVFLAANKDEISVFFMSWATAVYLALTLITGSMLQLIVWQEKERGAGLPD